MACHTVQQKKGKATRRHLHTHEHIGDDEKRQITKIKAVLKAVSKLLELQNSAMKNKVPTKFNKLSISEALETAIQPRDRRRINCRLYSTESSKVYSQW